MSEEIVIFWFRRDLRLEDNTGLMAAHSSGLPVLPLFIFDTNILDELQKNDPRVCFIYEQLNKINDQLEKCSSGLFCKKGSPLSVWRELTQRYTVKAVYCNEDYEPYARKRDDRIRKELEVQGIKFETFKDQVIFAKKEILKPDGTPYTVYTPYKIKWLENFQTISNTKYKENSNKENWIVGQFDFPSLEQLTIEASPIKVKNFNLTKLDQYDSSRDIPSLDTSNLSPHLRFGTVSIRQIIKSTGHNSTFLSELIWREFFMQILYHFPHVVDRSFKPKYDRIVWRNNNSEFTKWKNGETGYPIVDAGMRELNSTGYMHNRVRMITASFLCKHLLIDWRWGEAYFAEKLLDFELAANNGNWQWVAGSGCDAAPYFRVFNPIIQSSKFDPKQRYIRTWIPGMQQYTSIHPIVEHKFARNRAIETYKKYL